MKILKITAVTLLIIAVIGIGAVFGLEYYIDKRLQKEEGLSYTEFKMTFAGNVSFKELNFKNDLLEVQADEVDLKIGLMKNIATDTIIIKKATLRNITLYHFKSKLDSANPASKSQENTKKDRPDFALRTVDIMGLD